MIVKNGLKVKQLAKQHPTLKMLIQKILVEIFNSKFIEAEFLHKFFCHNLIVCNNI